MYHTTYCIVWNIYLKTLPFFPSQILGWYGNLKYIFYYWKWNRRVASLKMCNQILMITVPHVRELKSRNFETVRNMADLKIQK